MLWLKKILLAGTMLLLINFIVYAQPPAINFHHLTVKNGLNDGIINAIAQDKYGYMWFASYGAFNRFNGTSVKKYEHRQGDSTSAPGGIVYTMHCTGQGRLFAGSDDGLVEFDYNKDRFERIPAFRKKHVSRIIEIAEDELLLIADRQLFTYSLSKRQASVFYNPGEKEFYQRFAALSFTKSKHLVYIGTYGGYIVHNLQTRQSQFIKVDALAGTGADAILLDADSNIWISNIFSFKLIRINNRTGTAVPMHLHPAINKTGVQQSFLDFAADGHNVWIATSLTGLVQFNIHTQEVRFHQKDLLKPGSIAENILRTLHRTKDGTIWISMLGGIDYFHPDKNFFDIIFPFPDATANQFARGFTEDREGHYWFTTGDGVVRYNPAKNTYKIWRNEAGKPPVIYYNSARAVLADGNNIWIATGKGVNRYDLATGKMNFLTAKDSLPESFYLNINKDSRGFIWFCSNQHEGLYYFNPDTRKIHSIKYHPVLKQFAGYGVRRVFEDSKHRLWLGFAGMGYAMYNPADGEARYWYNSDGKDSSYNSNLVIDITEDKNQVIWLSTFRGVRGVDLKKDKEYWISTADGLKSNITNGIKADNFNRLWIGTSSCLSLVDSSRTNVVSFDESSGFASLEFPEHAAHVTSQGDFIFPSNKGYIKFNPASLTIEKQQPPFFIASVLVSNKPYTDAGNFKENTTLRLKPEENFVTITLEALNYTDAAQTWYAYKLDGLENEWHYTQDPKAVYTSVLGGTYTFRYKASADPGNWKVPEKKLDILVEKVFYKTTLFWLITAVILLLLLYSLYRYRLQQQQKLFSLESKAQLLEKEKTQVLFESLKQQLNPHFLFNSLTSLAGLIEADSKQAVNFLKQMSKIYRYILKSRDSDLVMLKEEIEMAQVYINLQQTRFKQGLTVTIDVSEEYFSRRLPPVTLQNMVENAIKHNIIDKDTPLLIEIFIDDDYLVVQNNLQKKPVVETSNKQGLAGLQSLYKYLSSRPVLIEESSTLFAVKLPLL